MSAWLSLIQCHRAIAVIRAPHFHTGIQMATAVAEGGMTLIEITWNSDRAADLVQHLRLALPNCTIGAGTLLSVAATQEAIAAGAQFLFTPHVEADLIATAHGAEIPLIAGALSPTEIMRAWNLGAASVKVFPVEALGGISYIRSLQGPLPHIPLIPTGGVTIANTADFLKAGAVGVGLASELFPKAAIARQDWGQITGLARQLVYGLHQDSLICFDQIKI